MPVHVVLHMSSRLESLQISRPRFRKFTINYIGNIKIVCPRSRLQDTNFPDWHVMAITSDCQLHFRANKNAELAAVNEQSG